MTDDPLCTVGSGTGAAGSAGGTVAGWLDDTEEVAVHLCPQTVVETCSTTAGLP